MKIKLILTIAILAIGLPAFAQDFTFQYDAAGNRIQRTFITLNKFAIIDTTIVGEETAKEEETAEEDKLHEKLVSFNLVVYPNPAKKDAIKSCGR